MPEKAKINPQWSEAYRKALTKNKGVMFICDVGRTRSRLAKEAAIRNGESQTVLLEGGLNYLCDNHPTNEQLQIALLNLASKYILRIFADYHLKNHLKNQQRVATALQNLVELELLEPCDYQFITAKDIVSEYPNDLDLVMGFVRGILDD